ncbi:MAG TPA: mucin 17-like protein, partial [Thermoanaerobaculia bacterium]|nr:mucin 17-like protein [Thermoanaerobaculia bacterium]
MAEVWPWPPVPVLGPVPAAGRTGSPTAVEPAALVDGVETAELIELGDPVGPAACVAAVVDVAPVVDGGEPVE